MSLSPEERDIAWRDWLDSRPEAVRVIAEHFPPWMSLRVKSTGQKAHIYSFGEREDGTVSIQVTVLHKENPGSLHEVLLGGDGVRVFGLAPSDLEPW